MSPKSILKSGVKTNLQTFEETKDEQESNALDNYLQRLMEDRQYKESPVIDTENKLEFKSHRKSGKSISPNRMGSERQSVSRFRESTNCPLTSSLSSDGNSMIEHDDELVILPELNELYHVFLSWLFSSRKDSDSSWPIRYPTILPLCLNLSAKSTKLMKQKALSDLNFMTAVEVNSSVIMKERTFSRWILDLLYSVFPPNHDSEKDPIWEMGCKLYIQLSKM